MLELLTALSFIGYLVYLRYYADQRTDAQKEADRLRAGIDFYESGQQDNAGKYFDRELSAHPKSSVAMLYQARLTRLKRTVGDFAGTRESLEQAKSFDSSIAELYLESGQLYYEQDDYPAASRDFDKAVHYSGGRESEPFHWRALTNQKLGDNNAFQQDMASAETAAANHTASLLPVAKIPFWDRSLFLHLVLAGLGSFLVLVVVRQGYGIHVPYLAAVLSGVVLGWLEPRKGWALTLFQVVVLWLAYTLFIDDSLKNDLSAFSLYGSLGLILVGGLLGGVLKRNVV